MRRFSMRELRRLMQHMQSLGIQLSEVKDVEYVVIKFSTGKEIVLYNPQVSQIKLPQGMVMYQVLCREQEVTERSITEKPVVEEKPKPTFTEEDVALVAAQAGVSLEEARRALEETGGDLAQAILLLQTRKRSTGT